jgi:predicted NBD/HSP70 family sugar kinase
MESNKRIGVDVGGSHVSASVVDISHPRKQTLYLIRKEINAFDNAFGIVETIGNCIKELPIGEMAIDSVGIAFPGPFDYEKGVSAIANVGGKFKQTFGLHVQQALKDITGLTNTPFVFSNDAHCFAVGAYHRYYLSSKRTVFLTLGTGFGSAFMENGVLLPKHPALPAMGAFYNESFLNAKADDYFSTRWFLNEYKQKAGKKISTVKELAETDPGIAVPLFNQFGANLGSFLLPWLQQFECDELVIGGNISRAGSLFSASLVNELEQISKTVNIMFCDDTEECILTGAAFIAGSENNRQDTSDHVQNKRVSTQSLLPVTAAATGSSAYNIFPSFESKRLVYKGFDSLAEKICNERIIIIDGYGGVLWELFRKQLHMALHALNKKIFWYDINSCLKPAKKIDAIIDDNLNGNDPVFGKKYIGNLVDFFDQQKLEMLQPDPAVDICIIYGTGAALSPINGMLIYLDVPKNEIQYRMRAGSVKNIGSNILFANTQMYKRFYFVDWPLLNRHKEQLLPKMDCIVDEQRMNEITWMQGNDFRSTLNDMLEQPLRARPWFEAGVWGGHWMKNNIKRLNKDEINYAWSFELITPENGIVIECEKKLLEVSFDFLLFYNNKKMLGKAAQRFGTEFPIRFDFLDTHDGGNLSIQCHPRTDYIREKFGENFTQDETYYIVDCEPDAKVYLGFQDDIDPCGFKQALTDAQEKNIELPVEKYAQSQARDFCVPQRRSLADGFVRL